MTIALVLVAIVLYNKLVASVVDIFETNYLGTSFMRENKNETYFDV